MTPTQIKAKLAAQGETFSSFARKHGYSSGKRVSEAIHRWAERTQGFPGGNTYRICVAVSCFIEEPISPVLSNQLLGEKLSKER